MVVGFTKNTIENQLVGARSCDKCTWKPNLTSNLCSPNKLESELFPRYSSSFYTTVLLIRSRKCVCVCVYYNKWLALLAYSKKVAS